MKKGRKDCKYFVSTGTSHESPTSLSQDGVSVRNLEVIQKELEID
jgi:hypothetical protein